MVQSVLRGSVETRLVEARPVETWLVETQHAASLRLDSRLHGNDVRESLIPVQAYPNEDSSDGVQDLGLASGDRIDALCLRENGSGAFDAGDVLMFSLAGGSPTLARLAASAADVLQPGPLRVAYTAGSLGLRFSDDIDALTCTLAPGPQNVFAPLVRRKD